MDAAKISDDPGAASSPATDFRTMTFPPPDDFSGLSKTGHQLIDAITACMTEEMGKLKQRYVVTIETYEERLVTWRNEKLALEDEKETLNASLLAAKKGENDLAAKLEAKDQQISQYESCMAGLQDINTTEFSEKLQSFWEKSKEFAVKYFLVDLSPEIFDQSKWDTFINQLGLKRGTPPLPLRNSEPAKKARVAAALATIASVFATRIFIPFYFYRPTPTDDFKELLIRLAEEDCKKELMCRAILLSGWKEDEQRGAEESLVQQATDAVSKRLGFWMGDSTKDAFGQDLLGLFKEAVELWRQTQYSTSTFEATVEDIDEPIWGVLSDLNDGDPPENSQAQPVKLALFPRIVIVGKEEDQTLFDGIGLWDWQMTAAEREWREDMEAKGRPKRGRRKPSNTGNGALTPTKLRGAPFLG